ncbi:MAG: STAS domain-containing protein [Alphaproteobacteria bacterium]|nr:STAS domain-containing protein [Alphaproteobacteria bacterium]
MKIPVLHAGNVLLTSLQDDLTDRDLQDMQAGVLEEIGRSAAVGLVMDVSALETVDSYIVRILSETAQMARVLGCEVVVCGIRPAVAVTLVRMDQANSDFETALDLEKGLALMRRLVDEDAIADEGTESDDDSAAPDDETD